MVQPEGCVYVLHVCFRLFRAKSLRYIWCEEKWTNRASKNASFSAKATTKQLGVDPRTDFNAMTRFDKTGSMVRKPESCKKRDVCNKRLAGIVRKKVYRNLSRIMRKISKDLKISRK